ncbi:hypothetical protein MNBD_CPR01-107 [hydrothermal vent metagenome]|uniref:Uncharacterized protein n=1 Tax=hydrothermal vent metagenome TaxID=652676 RepID=A0A3B0UZL7_9ZZZZ
MKEISAIEICFIITGAVFFVLLLIGIYGAVMHKKALEIAREVHVRSRQVGGLILNSSDRMSDSFFDRFKKIELSRASQFSFLRTAVCVSDYELSYKQMSHLLDGYNRLLSDVERDIFQKEEADKKGPVLLNKIPGLLMRAEEKIIHANHPGKRQLLNASKKEYSRLQSLVRTAKDENLPLDWKYLYPILAHLRRRISIVAEEEY